MCSPKKLGRPELDSVGQRRRRGNAERAGQGEGRIGNRDRRGACEKLGQRYSRGQRGTGDFRYAIHDEAAGDNLPAAA
jgi:hypothetical protein